MDYKQLQDKQRAYFLSGSTRSVEKRRDALRRMETAVKAFRSRIDVALTADMDKHPYETYLCEIALVLGELRWQRRHLRRNARDRFRPASWRQMPGHTILSPEPYGLALAAPSWDCPFRGCLMAVIGAVAAGNCVTLVPSAAAPETARLVAELLGSVFSEDYVAVVPVEDEGRDAWLAERWDVVYFAGDEAEGRAVAAAAAEKLTPVCLSLTGKSPVILDAGVSLKKAARRIAAGKVVDAGQSALAPDYLLLPVAEKDSFVEAYRRTLKKFFPRDNHSGMTSLVDDAHFERLQALLEGQDILLGGETDAEHRFIEPTLVSVGEAGSALMDEPILGPVLPVITYETLDEAIAFINARPKAPALYLFSKDKTVRRKVLSSCSFGSGCANNTLLQAAGTGRGCYAVGESGMGAIGGRDSWRTFSHERVLLRSFAHPQGGLRFFPYRKIKYWFMKLFMR